MFLLFSQLFQKQLLYFKYVTVQCSLCVHVYVWVNKETERVRKKVWWRERKQWREAEVAEQMAKWQDNKL